MLITRLTARLTRTVAERLLQDARPLTGDRYISPTSRLIFHVQSPYRYAVAQAFNAAGTYTVALPPMDGLPAGTVTWRFVALAGDICTAEYTIHRTA